MDAKNLVIIWLSLQVTILSFAVTKLSYDLGYFKGQVHVLTTFDPTPEGTKYAK